MPEGHTMNHLFAPPPLSWGLRGDPYLWRELRTRGRKVALPNTQDEVNEQRWEGLRDEEHVFHPALAHGGMSSGHVHVQTWRERLIPLVLARAKAPQDYYESSPF